MIILLLLNIRILLAIMIMSIMTLILPLAWGGVNRRVIYQKGGCCGWKPSQNAFFSIRVFLAYPLVEIRGNSTSVKSTLPLPPS